MTSHRKPSSRSSSLVFLVFILSAAVSSGSFVRLAEARGVAAGSVVQAGVASRETTHKAGEARNARIVGSITDADTGRPVPWAWVVLERIPGGSENDTPPGRADSVPARKKRGRSP